MPSPRVSVIIPTYHHPHALHAAISSVLAQDMSDFELWVVGDGCTDDTAHVVQRFDDPRVRWRNLPTNTGTPSAPRNEGMRLASGSHLAYLGHDDLWFPWHLSSLLSANHDTTDLAYSVGLSCGPAQEASAPNFAFSLPTVETLKRALVSPSNWLVSRHFAELAGPWSTELASGVDKDWLARAWRRGMRSQGVARLSVLRFPSSEWVPYRAGAACPQRPMLEAMQANPQRLECQLLTALASHLSCQPHNAPPPPPRSEFSTSLLYLRSALMTAYGRQRWPLRQLIRRHEERNARIARGLPPGIPGR